MDGSIAANPHEFGYAASVSPIRFIGLRFEDAMRVGRFNADDRKAGAREALIEPRRQRPSLDSNQRIASAFASQKALDRRRRTFDCSFTDNGAMLVHHADACGFR